MKSIIIKCHNKCKRKRQTEVEILPKPEIVVSYFVAILSLHQYLKLSYSIHLSNYDNYVGINWKNISYRYMILYLAYRLE
jgi:hypothetical protein